MDVTTTISIEEKRAYFDHLCAERAIAGYAYGWVAHRFRARFGHWPKFPKKATGESHA